MSDEDQQVSGVNWGWFAILASIIAIVGGTTYFLLPSLISKTVTDITVVKAIGEPIKVKPLDPGGEAVDHQDLLVVDILKGGNKADDQTETLRPTSPSPEPPPVTEVKTAAKSVLETLVATSENQSNTGNKAMVTSGDVAAQEPAKEIAKKPLPKAKPVAKNATVADTKTAANAKTSAKPIKPAKEKPAAAKADKDTTSKIKKRVIVIEGDEPLYMIQLAAFRNTEKATEMAKILAQKHKSRLQDVNLETMSVDTGSNGIFYRIVSAPLPRPDADKICGVLRRSGQDCFLRKYTAPSP
ncbi:SPOR domain-containing protein [Candidatus Puniceispirillum sp.]|nr:SPOR domain-containing protein [Candidatus Puniceispirillum sp.]